MENCRELLKQLSLEEKAKLVSGGDFWHTQTIEHLNIPKIMVADGPYGLRQQDEQADHLGINNSIKTICFPPACLNACSFDADLMTRLGTRLGKEAQAHQLDVILGPAVNIKRSPLLGRNFEYISEDPYVADQMAASLIKGIQSQGIGTSIKHFAANNQEWNRMSSSSEVDEATLNEVYLKPFEIAVKQAQPATVMASYNRINGTYSSENYALLTKKLRDEWGFKGLVISDWWAVADRIKGIQAGMDLEMPGDSPVNTVKIIEAVKDGNLAEKDLDLAVQRVLTLIRKCINNRHSEKLDVIGDRQFAQHVAEESIVLLKNDGAILPLAKSERVAFIGGFAKCPRFQGGGSSHINNEHLTSALDALTPDMKVEYAEGFNTYNDAINPKLEAEAISLAKQADKVVVFAGLPDSFESEGYDRQNLDLPASQNHLIAELLKVQSNIVVVLHNGSPVVMPWQNQVKGILEAYLGGQEIGAAEDNVLFGKVNPSGKLAETFPKRLEDTPAFLSFGSSKKVLYGEGTFVGYRYYDKRQIPVAFPFGYGLSYTTFEYRNGRISSHRMTDADKIKVSVDIHNAGKRFGKEVVQLYLKLPEFDRIRPVKELRQFQKVALAPGETATVDFVITKDELGTYDIYNHAWNPLSGEYQIMIGASSRDIRYQTSVQFTNHHPLPTNYDLNITIGELLKNPRARKWTQSLVDKLKQTMGLQVGDNEGQTAVSEQMAQAMINSMPLRQVVVSSIATDKELEAKLATFNGDLG